MHKGTLKILLSTIRVHYGNGVQGESRPFQRQFITHSSRWSSKKFFNKTVGMLLCNDNIVYKIVICFISLLESQL